MTLWLICDVDTEFDSFRQNVETPGQSNPGLTVGVPELLEFFDKYNLKATFHLQEQEDPKVSMLNRYPGVAESIEEFGQEFSLHVHLKHEQRKTREIAAGYDRLKDQGYKVDSFRAGWYFTNENTIGILEELGIKYDCSPYKNLTVGSKSWIGIPDSPYHPDYRDAAKVGNARVLMIPITDIRLGIGIHKDVEYESELIKRGIDILVSRAEDISEPVIIYFTTHSWKPVDEKGTLRMWEKRRREEFMEFLGQYEFKTLNVSEAGHLWKKGGYSPYFLDLPDQVGKYYPLYNPRRSFWLFKNIISRAHVLRYRALGKL